MSRTAGGTTNSYTWDVARSLPAILQETSGGSTTTYVYGRGLVYWVDSGGNPTYRLSDGLGSTVALADASGNVTAGWTYDVFGGVHTHTGENTEFTFTGEQNDPNGLEYLRARYYDPATGRLLSRDPLGGGYAYGGNNPANFTDPSGMEAVAEGDGGGGAAVLPGPVNIGASQADANGDGGADVTLADATAGVQNAVATNAGSST